MLLRLERPRSIHHFPMPELLLTTPPRGSREPGAHFQVHVPLSSAPHADQPGFFPTQVEPPGAHQQSGSENPVRPGRKLRCTCSAPPTKRPQGYHTLLLAASPRSSLSLRSSCSSRPLPQSPSFFSSRHIPSFHLYSCFCFFFFLSGIGEFCLLCFLAGFRSLVLLSWGRSGVTESCLLCFWAEFGFWFAFLGEFGVCVLLLGWSSGVSFLTFRVEYWSLLFWLLVGRPGVCFFLPTNISTQSRTCTFTR